MFSSIINKDECHIRSSPVTLVEPFLNTLLHPVTIPFLSLYLYAGSGRSLNSSQVPVMPIAKATRNCTLEASSLFQINNTTTFILHKLFICLKVKLATSFANKE
jgi:hypothetical protein